MRGLLSRYDLFIFDWDNTLVSTHFLINLAHLFKPRYIRYSRMPKSLPTASPIRIKEKTMEAESEIYARIFDLYLLFFKPKPKPYAKELLSILKNAKKKIAVFSDGKGYRVVKEARLQGLFDYFDIILSADMVNAYKPNPAPLIAIVDKFGVSKSKALYIGDMVIDIVTAKSAGIDVCAVADGLSSSKALEQAEPNYLVSSLKSLISLVKQGKSKS